LSEIVDALGIAVMVNAGAALVYSARTVDAFQAAVAGSADLLADRHSQAPSSRSLRATPNGGKTSGQ